MLCLLSIQSKAANSFTDSTTNTFTWDANKAFQTIRIGYNVGFKPYGVTNLNLKDQNVTSVIFAEMDIYDNNGIFFEFVNQPMMHIDEGLQELDFVFTSYSFYYDLYVRSRSYSVGYVHTFQLSESMDLSARGSIGRMDMDIREYATDKETLEVDQYEHSEKSTIASLSGKFTYWLPNNVGLSAEAAIGYYAPIAKLGLTYRIKTL
ncbi:MAG: hypothetical protein HKP14_11200 [Bacteroidia bacterium]|nr:hypothetical protein [Bacteroidia bacterium]